MHFGGLSKKTELKKCWKVWEHWHFELVFNFFEIYPYFKNNLRCFFIPGDTLFFSVVNCWKEFFVLKWNRWIQASLLLLMCQNSMHGVFVSSKISVSKKQSTLLRNILTMICSKFMTILFVPSSGRLRSIWALINREIMKTVSSKMHSLSLVWLKMK